MAVSSQLDFLTETEQVALPAAIPGLAYLPDYIDQQQEAELIHAIKAQPWIADLKRRVQHYGYRYDYKARYVTSESYLGPLPEWVSPYCNQLRINGFFPQLPDQVIVNEYEPGQGIAPHIDCVPCFTDTIASLSLNSSCIMQFLHIKTQQKIHMLLEPRSLVVLSGDARYQWQHSIPPRKSDRYKGEVLQRKRRLSLTFRKMALDMERI